MFMGINYPYWETFNLRSVFPKLEDALKSFPSSQIYNQIVLDWPTLRDQIGDHAFSTPDLMRKIETLYGAYLVALSKGATPYRLAERTPRFQTASFMVQQTGINRAVVVAFLTTLEKLAKAGTISQKYWDPDRVAAANKEVTKRQEQAAATEPKGPLDKAASTVKWVGVTALVLAAAGIVVAIKIK